MRTRAGKQVLQAGVIPYRRARGVTRVLLITSSRGNWIVPKGNIEPGLTPRRSAEKEALEEAGVVGRVQSSVIGSFRTRKNGRSYRVDLYMMKVARLLPTWSEEDVRERAWFDLEDAIERVALAGLRRCLESLGAQGRSRTAA